MTERAVNPETPWEFLADDEEPEETELPAEEAALHIESPDEKPPLPRTDPEIIAHYMPDEEPEFEDFSEEPESLETTPEVEDLLIRQHYMTRDE